MYNIYISNANAENKGKSVANFTNNPLYFDAFTRMAIPQFSMWNAVYNISQYWGNNKLYIRTTKNLLGSGGNNIYNEDTNPYNKFAINLVYTNSTTIWLYEIIIQDGIYDVDSLNEYIAKLVGDWNWTTNTFKAYNERLIVFDKEERLGKILITLNKTNTVGTFNTDILFLASPSSKSLEYLLGFNLSILPSNIITPSITTYTMNQTTSSVSQTLSLNGIQMSFYSLNDYNKANSFTVDGTNGGSPLSITTGSQISQINLGITQIHLRLTNNIVFAGYDSKSANTDTIFAFMYDVSPNYLQNIQPTNLTWFDITSTNIPIDRLNFSLTDQDGNELGYNVFEPCSFTLLIDPPVQIK